MASLIASPFFVILLLCRAAVSASFSVTTHKQDGEIRSFGRRLLLGFIETPGGSNVTFECSPSGPCLPCLYSEKNKEKYRCSETGYRVPFKCKEIIEGSHATDGQKTPNGRSALEMSLGSMKSLVLVHDADEVASSMKPRNLLDDSSASKRRSQSYITYRSCVPNANEEKLSVIGFEGIMIELLIISGTVVYIRKRRTVSMPGVSTGRSQGDSRFWYRSICVIRKALSEVAKSVTSFVGW